MSAFMVSHECITRVVFAARAELLADARLYHNSDPDPDMLGMQLIELNRLAIKARYGERPAVEPYRYQAPALYVASQAEVMQLFKSLRCYLYQCSEGDVPEAPLFKRIEQVRNRLAGVLGYDTEKHRFTKPELQQVYDACEWG